VDGLIDWSLWRIPDERGDRSADPGDGAYSAGDFLDIDAWISRGDRHGIPPLVVDEKI
jgi:hypothetical protein